MLNFIFSSLRINSFISKFYCLFCLFVYICKVCRDVLCQPACLITSDLQTVGISYAYIVTQHRGLCAMGRIDTRYLPFTEIMHVS